MDAPSHCIAGGRSIAEIPLQSLITSCCVIDVSKQATEDYLIPVEDVLIFENKHETIKNNSLVIFYTGWSQYWNQPEQYRNNLAFPSLAPATAEYLLTKNIAGIGIDTLSPDRADSGFPVHKILLSADKYIIENVANADKLPPMGACTIALPMKIAAGTEAPIRLIGIYS
jgi:kynurenine formamidase